MEMGKAMQRLSGRIVAALALGGLLAALGACNTVKGLGRDIESVGRAGERAL
jgi:entericidin B